ncbi:MAG: sodium:calcium antiporter [Planctomycetota bacterium]|jgi:cation:H+ antiporter
MAYLHLLLGLGGLLLGSDLAVRGSVALAHRWGWPSWVTGLLLLALGTSLPELFVCIASAPEYPGLAAGNIFGSNAFNVGLVLGATLLLKGDARLNARSVRIPTLLPLVFGSLMAFTLMGMPLTDYGFSLLFLLFYAVMILASIALRDKEFQPADDAAPDTHWNLPVALAATAAGFMLLAFSSGWFLDGALSLAATLGWQEGFAGFIITAIGTSAPELFTSIRALRLGHAGAVFGNVVGSNAFNLLMAGGTVGLLAEVQVPQEGLGPQLVVNMAATAILVFPALATNKMRELSSKTYRVMGCLLIGLYFSAAWWIS